MNTKSVLLFSSLFLGCWAQMKSYAGYGVFETETVNKNNLKTLYLHSGQWDFLRGPILGLSSHILVSPEELSDVKQTLNSENIGFKVVEEDVQRLLDENRSKLVSNAEKGSISFQQYLTLSEVNAYLDKIEQQYPKLASVLSIGNSTEGRPIKIIKISSGGEKKPVIFVETTMHAREWIATCAAVYLISQLVENYTDNCDLVDKVDWYIIPVVNVDGYEYSHTKDRYWRKTRSDTGFPECKGVDGNRNFPYEWEGTFMDYPCSPLYPGKFAMSEPEVQAVINFSTSIKERLKLYVSLHSYGPILMYPWGYTHNLPEDEADLRSLGNKAIAAVRNATGTDYLLGSISRTMYEAPGSSTDWIKGELGVKYSYSIEVNSGGYMSFDPPPYVILPSVTEAFEIFKAFGQYFGSGGS